jgi:TolB protein
MKKLVWLAVAAAGFLLILHAQDISTMIDKSGGRKVPMIALPDFKGSGEAQAFMSAFNQTLLDDVSGSGVVKVAPKTLYPLTVPQQPSDFTQPPPPVTENPRGRKAATPPPPTSGGGRWLSDWAGPPVSANYLASGYTAPQNGVLVLYGWVFDLSRGTATEAKVVEKRYLGSVDEAGARKVAHEFAADIVGLFGGQSLFGTHIYFVSNRTGNKEIWVMDPDGKNQRQFTHYNFLSIEPAVSPDGSKIAFTSFVHRNAGIFVFSVDPVRDLRFYNQSASVNSSPSFSPDGKQVIYSSSAPGSKCCRIFIANLDGTGFRAISSMVAIDTEPKINPKTGSEILFTSGRSGPQQVYKMNMDGADIERLSDGTGEAGNATWHPDGQIIAFAWTRGFAAGAWNIFVMDVASKRPNQLTHGEGRNEQPTFSPDGNHLAFASTRNGRYQIYTMLADGTHVQQLTTAGTNDRPFWGK